MLIRSSFALAALSLTFACASTEEKPAEDKPVEEKAAEVVDYKTMTERYNAGDYAGAAAMFTDDFKARSTGENGRAALVKRWEEAKPLSPQVAISRHIQGEGMWVAQGVMHGEHTGEYRGVAATNKKYAVDFVHVGWTDEAGHTKELLSITPVMAIAAQLEMMKGPPPPALSEIPASTEMVSGAATDGVLDAANAIYAAYESGDVSKVDAHIAEDAVVYMRAHGKKYEGLAAIKEAMGAERKGFTERKAETETVAIGDYVVVFGKVTAKHTGQVGPTPPTNKVVSWHFADVVKFKDGKLVEGSFYYNPGEVMRQLGPPPGHGGPAH
jgi:ketosteroid isomerase-like protein